MRAVLIITILAVLGCGCHRSIPTTARHGDELRPATPPQSRPTPPVGGRGATQPGAAASRVVKPFDDITVHLEPGDRSCVEVKSWVCLDEGWLEQIACSPATREHESLVVVKAKPSQIHAALLMAGFQPGTPGRWTFENNTLGTIDPTGERLDVLVRYADPSHGGAIVEHPIRKWIRNGAEHQGRDPSGGANDEFPDLPWVFGGSVIVPNPKSMGPGEHYIADESGSIIGLVTFGDEVIGFSRIFADQDAVQPREWEVNTAVIPPVGTEVTLILRKSSPSVQPQSAPR